MTEGWRLVYTMPDGEISELRASRHEPIEMPEGGTVQAAQLGDDGHWSCLWEHLPFLKEHPEWASQWCVTCTGCHRRDNTFYVTSDWGNPHMPVGEHDTFVSLHTTEQARFLKGLGWSDENIVKHVERNRLRDEKRREKQLANG